MSSEAIFRKTLNFKIAYWAFWITLYKYGNMKPSDLDIACAAATCIPVGAIPPALPSQSVS